MVAEGVGESCGLIVIVVGGGAEDLLEEDHVGVDRPKGFEDCRLTGLPRPEFPPKIPGRYPHVILPVVFPILPGQTAIGARCRRRSTTLTERVGAIFEVSTQGNV